MFGDGVASELGNLQMVKKVVVTKGSLRSILMKYSNSKAMSLDLHLTDYTRM